MPGAGAAASARSSEQYHSPGELPLRCSAPIASFVISASGKAVWPPPVGLFRSAAADAAQAQGKGGEVSNTPRACRARQARCWTGAGAGLRCAVWDSGKEGPLTEDKSGDAVAAGGAALAGAALGPPGALEEVEAGGLCCVAHVAIHAVVVMPAGKKAGRGRGVQQQHGRVNEHAVQEQVQAIAGRRRQAGNEQEG